MSFISRIFGMPTAGNNEVYSPYNNWWSSLTGNTSARWVNVDNSKLWNIYTSTPHLALVINRKAEMASTMNLRHIDSKGEDIENSEILNFLKNPNVIFDWDNFWMNLFICSDVYSNLFIYKNASIISGAIPRALWILQPDLMQVELTGRSLDQTKKNQIIKQYQYNSTGSAMFNDRVFKPSEIMHSKKNNRADDVIGTSKIVNIQKNISNLNTSLEARNILTRERGGIGIISGVNSNSGMVLSKKEKDEIDKEFNKKYGITEGKKNKIITSTELKWTPMNFDVKQLQLSENVKDDFMTVCDTFGMPSDIFSLIMNSTYENKSTAMVGAYENTIIPESNAKLNELSNFLGLTDKGERLISDFSHLPIMQKSEKERAETRKINIESRERAWSLVTSGGMSQDEYNKIYQNG